MKQKLLSIKYRLVALWWFLTRKNYYLLSYNGRVGKTLESTNIVIPEFIEWVRKKHGVPTKYSRKVNALKRRKTFLWCRSLLSCPKE